MLLSVRTTIDFMVQMMNSICGQLGCSIRSTDEAQQGRNTLIPSNIYVIFLQDYYELKNRKESPPWTERFENIVKYAIHPSCLRNTPLHKGDFYIHISESKPRTLELKYLHGDKTQTRNLSMTDNILMCSENWTELLRSDTHDRFVFTSCILWTSRGFEKSSWSNVLMGRLPTMMDSKGMFCIIL